MSINTAKKVSLSFGTLAMAAFLAVGCGDAAQQNDSETKIYGGKPTPKGQFYSAVALTNRYLGVYCTGTAITPTIVVTAAHCIQAMGNPADNYIYVGNGKEDGMYLGQFQVKSAEASPAYSMWSMNNQNDIGYVVLAEPIPLPQSAFVPVLTKKAEIAEVLRRGKPSRVIGFGGREDGGVGVKYEIDTTINSVGTTEIGIGGNGKDSCQGDSGGPAYTQLANGEWRVFGVVSRGGQCGYGGIYGLMHANICWIQQDSGIDLGLPKGTCDGVKAAVSASRPE